MRLYTAMASISGLIDTNHPISQRFGELAIQNIDKYLALPVDKILPPYTPRVQYKDFAWSLNQLFGKTLTAFAKECGIVISMPNDYLEFIELCEKTNEHDRKQILDMINTGYFGNPWWNYTSTVDGRDRINQIIDHKIGSSIRKYVPYPITENILQVRQSPTCVARFDTLVDVANNFHISFRWLCCSTSNSHDLSELPYVDDIFDAYSMMHSFNFDDPRHPIPSRYQIILKETMRLCAKKG